MRLLYVCSGNSFRSPAAEALSRKEQPGLEVESAGTEAIDYIADPTKDYLEEQDAIQFLKPSPDQISERAVEEADLVVCMMPRHRQYVQKNFDAELNDIDVWHVRDGIEPGVEPWSQLRKIHDKVRGLEE